MAKGGKRAGSGRKKGSKSVGMMFRQYIKESDIKTYVEYMLSSYMGSDKLATWVGEYLFVKPVQSIDVTSGGEKLPAPLLVALGPRKNTYLHPSHHYTRTISP